MHATVRGKYESLIFLRNVRTVRSVAPCLTPKLILRKEVSLTRRPIPWPTVCDKQGCDASKEACYERGAPFLFWSSSLRELSIPHSLTQLTQNQTLEKNIAPSTHGVMYVFNQEYCAATMRYQRDNGWYRLLLFLRWGACPLRQKYNGWQKKCCPYPLWWSTPLTQLGHPGWW